MFNSQLMRGSVQKKFILFNIIMNIVRVGGIYLSMPYWSKLGLM